MAKIQVKVESFAQESVVQEILSTANANTPAGMTPSAIVMRDANGKVVQVEVNLPVNIAQADLHNASNKINENHGVAVSNAYPNVNLGDFNTLTPGTELSSIDLGNMTVSIAGAQNEGAPSAAVYAAASVDSKGGTGSALEIRDVDTANVICYKELHYSAINLNVTDFGGFTLKTSIKTKEIDALSQPYDWSGFGFNTGGALDFTISDQGGVWVLEDGLGASNKSLGALSVTSYVDFEITLDLNGDMIIKANGNEVHRYANGFVPRLSEVFLAFENDINSADDGLHSRSILLDDMSFTILS